MKILVFIKQVPNQSKAAGMKPDGTIDRAAAEPMMNPFDMFALEAALQIKDRYGADITAISMGPKRAQMVLETAMEAGTDDGILLTDRKLAASDTLATAYALYKVVELHESKYGKVDLLLTGLQTTDGDTGQVGPQIAERMDLPQITYCEELLLEGDYLRGKRVIEGGYEWLRSPLPCLVTVANTAKPLRYSSLRNIYKVKQLRRENALPIQTWSLEDIQGDEHKVGLEGSPTIVKKTEKVKEKGVTAIVFNRGTPKEKAEALLKKLIEDGRELRSLAT